MPLAASGRRHVVIVHRCRELPQAWESHSQLANLPRNLASMRPSCCSVRLSEPLPVRAELLTPGLSRRERGFGASADFLALMLSDYGTDAEFERTCLRH